MAADVGDGQADEPNFEINFAQLAARLGAQGGGGLSPELSTELALEIVLNEIVEQACLTTGATGSAIVLRRDGEMVCRASSGLTAPDLGSRLDEASGISGECIRTRRTQRCDDVLEDPRVDRDASEQLGVRSVTVMPLMRDAELVGVFELFSSLPNAFGESEEQKLEALGAQVLSSLERSVQPLPAPPEPPPDRPIQDILPEEPEIPVSRRGFDWLTSILGIAVLACAILLGILIGGHLKMQKRVARAYPAQSSALAVKPAGSEHTSDNSGVTSKQPGENPSRGQSAPKPVDRTSVPEGGLLIFENGKEVFRMPAEPNQAEKKQMVPASSAQPNNTLPLSPAEVESGLLHRVEPEYPEGARQAGIQGAVVLDILIGVDGAVQSVRLMSGPPELAQASIDAVKQWRFKPRVVDGRQAGVQTTLTLSFKLPPQ